MSTEIASELVSFHRFVTHRLDQGQTDLSPEEVLDLWRAENPSSTEYADTVAALREALGDMEAGDTGVPLEAFDRDFRLRHNIPPTP